MLQARFLAALFFAASLVITPTVHAQPAASTPSAFTDYRPKARAAAPAPDANVRRSRAVMINMSLFDRNAAKSFIKQKRSKDASARKVLMNLFPDLGLAVHWQNAETAAGEKSVIWTGTVDGQPLSQVVMVVSDNSVTGNIVTNGIIYEVRPGNDGEHWIREMDPAAYPPELEPRRAPSAPFTGPNAVAEAASPDDNGSVIDVMVVYSAAARQAAGGEDKMRQLIQLGFAETNQGYANSRINHRLRLVATGEVNYQETGSFDKDLDRLSDPRDGFLDEIHAARDRVGADLVSLWVESGDACGIGWMLDNTSRANPELGFSVVRRNCATGYYSFGHELGHNLGATHAPDDGGSDGAYPYSRGFKQTTRAPFFRSVMAYDCQGGCQRINYWSSPELNYQGSALGERNKNDNRTTLNNTAAIVASYRRSTQNGGTTPPPNPGPSTAFPESSHPYSNDMDRTWTYEASGNPSSISVTFDGQTYVEEDYDYIAIYDGNGRQIQGSPFTGNALAGKTITIPGTIVKIRLVTDESEVFYGFKITNITSGSGSSGGSRVDLVTLSFTASTSATIGGKLNGLVARVQNQGNAPAPEFRIGFYWLTPEREAVFSGWYCTVQSLAPGSTFTCGGDIGVAASLKPGVYQIAVVADDQKQSGDADFDNNAKLSEGGAVTIR